PDFAFCTRGGAFHAFDYLPTGVALLLLGVFVRALADAGRINGRECLHLAIAHVKIESVYISICEIVRRIGPSTGIVAARVEQKYDLSHASFFDPAFDTSHADRSFFQERD